VLQPAAAVKVLGRLLGLGHRQGKGSQAGLHQREVLQGVVLRADDGTKGCRSQPLWLRICYNVWLSLFSMLRAIRVPAWSMVGRNRLWEHGGKLEKAVGGDIGCNLPLRTAALPHTAP
jgi:hypothetical protein